MENKLRQITDTVHGTIYLSELEAALISTPYFYRLHDIYQSSTVYTVYPCNRTKRYEHSLGTMSVASEMLFSAVSRAEKDVQEQLFSDLLEKYRKIISLVASGTVPCYYHNNYSDIEELFLDGLLKEKDGENITDILETVTTKAAEAGLFSDEALGNYQYYPMNFDRDADPTKGCGTDGLTCGVTDNAEKWFAYRCMLQAIRIVALFHDVGHPPFSHIIEAEMKSLFDEVVGGCEDEDDLKRVCDEKNLNFRKAESFQKCLKPYFDADVKCSSDMLYAKMSLESRAQSHERIGIKLLQLSIRQIVSEYIQKALNSDLSVPNKAAYIIYYTTIAEFAIAIWSEQDEFFKSLHKIVDGTIDADRLDYVVRDSANSGVDWGVIPYKRIVDAARFCHPEGHPKIYAVAFPQKVAEDLEDLLITRYKIYERINYHHRTIKSSMALRAAVHDLVIDYLSHDKNKDVLCPNISTLWEALSPQIGEKGIRIIKWNDSWLTTTLHEALIKVYEARDASQYLALKENLEEFLLGKKRYYPLLKRGVDNKKLLDAVFEKAGLSQNVLREKTQKEWEKLYKTEGEDASGEAILTSPNACAQDAIFRLKNIQRSYESGDFYPLNKISFPVGEELETLLDDTMRQLTESTALADYRIYVNSGKRKDGLPKNDEDPLSSIYLFNGKSCFPMDTEKTAKMHIDAVAKNIPYLYIYFSAKDSASDIDRLGEQLFERITDTLAEQLKYSYEELFGPVQQQQLNKDGEEQLCVK